MTDRLDTSIRRRITQANQSDRLATKSGRPDIQANRLSDLQRQILCYLLERRESGRGVGGELSPGSRESVEEDGEIVQRVHGVWLEHVGRGPGRWGRWTYYGSPWRTLDASVGDVLRDVLGRPVPGVDYLGSGTKRFKVHGGPDNSPEQKRATATLSRSVRRLIERGLLERDRQEVRVFRRGRWRGSIGGRRTIRGYRLTDAGESVARNCAGED